MEHDERWDICTRVLVACSDFGDSRYVLFAEAGAKVHEVYGPDVSGIFLKVAGQEEVLKLPAPASDREAEWAEVLDALRKWVNLQEPGVAILLAMLGVPHGRLAVVMAVMQPLGVPQSLPPPELKAFAAVGVVPRREACLPEGGFGETELWSATHASLEMASAAMPWAP